MVEKKPRPRSPCLGCWHIISMSAWDESDFNEEVQAFIEFKESTPGEFQFGYVRGELAIGRAFGTESRPSSGPGRGATVPTVGH
jgi:hypothetical protein